MAERYGVGQRGTEVCPGELDCPRFDAAGGEGISYDEQCKACTSCALLPTKPKGQGAKTVVIGDDIATLVNVIEAITIEAASGFGPELQAMTPLVYEGLLEWKACEIAYRRNYEAQIGSLFSAILKRNG